MPIDLIKGRDLRYSVTSSCYDPSADPDCGGATVFRAGARGPQKTRVGFRKSQHYDPRRPASTPATLTPPHMPPVSEARHAPRRETRIPSTAHLPPLRLFSMGVPVLPDHQTVQESGSPPIPPPSRGRNFLISRSPERHGGTQERLSNQPVELPSRTYFSPISLFRPIFRFGRFSLRFPVLSFRLLVFVLRFGRNLHLVVDRIRRLIGHVHAPEQFDAR